MRNELANSFGVELPATVTFDFPTPTALANFIASQTVGAVAAPSMDEGSIKPADVQKMAAPSEALIQDTLAEVAAIVSGLLGTGIGVDEPLMAAGLDSLGKNLNSRVFFICYLSLNLSCLLLIVSCSGAVQLRNAVNEQFGIELPATAALDFPTTSALADFLVKSIAPYSNLELDFLGGHDSDDLYSGMIFVRSL